MARRGAVVFYGFSRTLRDTAASVRRHVLERYDCDLYVHTPYDPGALVYQENPFGDRLRHLTVNHAYSQGDFTQFVIDHRIPPTIRCGDPPRNNRTFKAASMFHHMQRSLREFQEVSRADGLRYQYVILTRPDLLYHFDSDALTGLIDAGVPPDTVHFSLTSAPGCRVGRVCHDTTFIDGQLRPAAGQMGEFNDQFLIGQPAAMAAYATLFDRCPDLYRDGVVFDNETIIAHHALRCGVSLQGHALEFFRIKRPW